MLSHLEIDVLRGILAKYGQSTTVMTKTMTNDNKKQRKRVVSAEMAKTLGNNFLDFLKL